jgi:hypothetical protein
MNALGGTDRGRAFLATAIATPREKRVAAVIAVVAVLAFLAALPFVRVPLARMPAFIPAYEAALILIDLVTAILLFEQFVRLRLIALLALAAGYLFDALIIVPHALTFPGAFAPTGLLGAGPQTTAWLYAFWHGGFPLFVMAYALLRRREDRPIVNVGRAIVLSAIFAAALAAVLAVAATVGHDALPVIMQGSDYTMMVTKGVSPAVWLLTFIAMLMLWQRQQRIVDLWLMLVMWVWLFDIALAAVIGSSRFDLGFYAGRVFGLIAASFLLVSLLVEMAALYVGVLGQAADAERRFAELARTRTQPGQWPAPKLSRETPEAFIIHQNIANYRARLAEAGLNTAQRQAIETLLAEEQAKLHALD